MFVTEFKPKKATILPVSPTTSTNNGPYQTLFNYLFNYISQLNMFVNEYTILL